jgi:hypothetical protein
MRTATITLATMAALAVAPAAAHGATTCTWSGATTQHPGITNSPSPVPMHFRATGPLAGGPGCRGTFTFDGVMDAGSTCAAVTFHGAARGLPGVARFAGVSIGGVAPARLYDRHGNVVGSENAEFLTGANVADCNTPEGMTGNHFSSVIVLPGAGRRAARANTFEGTCRLRGELRFDQPLGNAPTTTTFTDSAAGTCSGTLNGTEREDMPVRNVVSGAGTLSCAGGRALSHDMLIFPGGTRIHFVSDSTAILAGGVSHFTGDVSGDGVVAVTFDVDEATLSACQAGALRAVRYSLVARTVTPVAG